MIKKTISLIAAVLAVGCSEISSPIDGVSFGKASPESDPGEVAVSGDVPPTTVVHESHAPRLLTYETSFTAVQGEANTFVVFYEDEWNPGMQGDWFLKLDIPRDAQLVGEFGAPAAPGDSVEITVVVDSSLFFVQFGPHGSVFQDRKPATLRINYAYAEEAGLEEDLAVWYQPAVGQLWTKEPTEVHRRGKRVSVSLRHFSNYAVAW